MVWVVKPRCLYYKQIRGLAPPTQLKESLHTAFPDSCIKDVDNIELLHIEPT